MITSIAPHLWFTEKAEEACAFYVSVFPDSHIDRVSALPADSPSGPAGTVKMVEFTLNGRPFFAIGAGPLDPFNHAISLLVHCQDQAEIDRTWDGLLAGGGQPEQCGWLKDRYGLLWQVSAAILPDMLADPDRERAGRVAQAMMKMVKIDIAALQRAYEKKAA